MFIDLFAIPWISGGPIYERRCSLKLPRCLEMMLHLSYLPKIILRDDPKLWPDCVAPRLVPAWSPMIDSLARICSSLKSRRFSSDGRGPRNGPRHSG